MPPAAVDVDALSTSSSGGSERDSMRSTRPASSSGGCRQQQQQQQGGRRGGSLTAGAWLRSVVARTAPGVYLLGRLDRFKQRQRDVGRRRVTESELRRLNRKIDKLLTRLDDVDTASESSVVADEDECVICLSATATMQTFPCAHRVTCRRCFVRTIQTAIAERSLPLRCVVCRSRILKLNEPIDSPGGGSALPASTAATTPAASAAFPPEAARIGCSAGRQADLAAPLDDDILRRRNVEAAGRREDAATLLLLQPPQLPPPPPPKRCWARGVVAGPRGVGGKASVVAKQRHV